jgi:hypothetical protein
VSLLSLLSLHLFASWLLLSAASAASEDRVPGSHGVPLEPIQIGSPERIVAEPARIQLDSPRSRMRIIVTGHYAGGTVQDLTRAASLTTTNDQVVRIENGCAVPVANGTADLVASTGDHEITVPVEVTSIERPAPISFHYETLAALTKQGCNAGACHGSPSGKGGFRLSLLAYDPALDSMTLIRESYGRRTNVLAPAASLLLLKPTMQVSHGGGLRLRKSDPAYAVLRDWIAEGCRVDTDTARHCVKLEVLPVSPRVLKRPAHTQQLVVLAHFSDGTRRDVTRIAKYSSSDDALLSVDAEGFVVGSGRGGAAVMVRYLDKVETCHFTLIKDIDGFVWHNPPIHNDIDRLVYEKLKQLQYLPSDLCSDEEFVRRIFLDVVGLLPTASEVQSFLNDPSPDKRRQLVDALLERPDHARFWALKWGDLLRLNSQQVTPDGMYKYHAWLVRSLEENMPWDQFCRQLLTAQGSTFENPPANYYRTASDTSLCAETSAQLFLGVRIQCAKCHNHPFERWTQDNYYGLAAFFNRVQRKDGLRSGELVVWLARGGDVTQPRTGAVMKPWLPSTGEVAEAGDRDRREIFAEWLSRGDNPFFARVAVNRMWAEVMGRGIVEPVDDFRDSNPPANSELLDALARDFREHGFDRKHILRAILNSRTYQLSSQANDFNRDDAKYFSHAQVRMLSAEQLLDAICQVTGVDEPFEGLPPGTRATQLPGPDGKNDFLKIFGQPERQTACACERASDSNLSQALQLFNGPLVHGKIKHADNRFRKLVAAGKTDPEIVQELYLAALSRKPREVELAAAVSHVTAKPDRLEGLEDVCWALLNTNEFLFQH